MRITSILMSVLVFISLSCAFSCGRAFQKRQIEKLESQFHNTAELDQKTKLANRLHKLYSLYYLEEGDTLFLRSWANLAKQGGEYEEARKIYHNLIKGQAHDASLYLNLSKVNKRLGYIRAAACCDSVAATILLDSREKTYYSQRAERYHKLASRIESAAKAIEIGIDQHRYKLLRAHAYLNLELHDAALYDIQEVLDNDSTNTYGHYLMASVLYDQERNRFALKAIDSYRKHASLNDSLNDRIDELAQSIAFDEQFENLHRKINQGKTTYEELIRLGRKAFERERVNASKLIFNRLITAYPDSIFGYLYRGQLYIKMGLLDKAENDLKKGLKLNPDNISTHNLLGYTYLLKKEYGSMEKEVEKVLALGGEPLEILVERNAEQK